MNKNKKYVLQRCMAGILSLTGLVACFTGCNNSTQIEKNQTEISQTSDSNKETTEAKKEETTRVEEQKKLIDDEKYKAVKQDIKAIQNELHIPDKYMEIPEVLDSIMQVIDENENYMLGFIATDLDERLENLGSNKVRYSFDRNFSYNETYDQLVIFNNIDGQKHKIEVVFYGQDSPYYIEDSIVFDKDGNPINDIIITYSGLDFIKNNEDYIEYNASKNYIGCVYASGDKTFYLYMLDCCDIDITIKETTNNAHISGEYRIKTTEDYKEIITRAFNERNHAEMKKIFDELIKNNSISICEMSGIATSDGDAPNHIKVSLDNNKLLVTLYKTELEKYESLAGVMTFHHYTDPYQFEYTITDEEEEELAKYILNGDCDSAVDYAKILDSKYKK